MSTTLERIVILFLVQILIVPYAQSIPIRGNYPWSVVLCKFRDRPITVPHQREWFDKWLNDETLDGSVSRYFGSSSNGMYTIRGSDVHGWFTLPYTKSDIYHLVRNDPHLATHLKNIDLKFYYKVKEVCVKHAKFNGARLHSRVITVINDDNTAVFCKESGVLLTPGFLVTSALAHEMTHSFNIGHSYSDQPVKIFPYSSVGEYDDKYDLMSTSNAYMYTSFFGLSGPGLNGPHLDYLGWFPANRVRYFGRNGAEEEILRLSSISVDQQRTRDFLLILIPYDRDNPMNVFTVELRTPANNDRGVGKGGVVIHQIKKRNGHFFSYVMTHNQNYYELVEGTEWLEFIVRSIDGGYQHIRVKVEKVNPRHHTADVRVVSTFHPEACGRDEEPRFITDEDFVCVSHEEQKQIKESNRKAAERRDRFRRCTEDYVRRLATPSDDVCVTSEQKAVIDAQNERARKRGRFFDLQTWGLNSCKDGFVWRQLDHYDYKCVTRKRREMAISENNRSVSRTAPNGQCLQGFVPRLAFSGDRACVSSKEQRAVLKDTIESKSRYEYYGFFNGVDSVFNLYESEE